MKFLIILIIVLIVVGLIFGISTIYRFCKIQNILSDVKDNIEKDNYYMKTIIKTPDETMTTETYYKGGIGKFVAQDGTYTWFDGESSYIIDEINKTAKKINPKDAVGLVFKESFASLYPCFSKNIFEKFIFAGNHSNSIKTENYNGEKCTVITIEEENYTKTYWITRKWSNLIKAKIEFANGEIYEYKYEIKFHMTKLKDIELPDFTEYTIIDTTEEKNSENTSEIIEEKQTIESENIVVENIIYQENDNLPN